MFEEEEGVEARVEGLLCETPTYSLQDQRWLNQKEWM
jgi:hypothetical protein